MFYNNNNNVNFMFLFPYTPNNSPGKTGLVQSCQFRTVSGNS